MDAIWTNDVNDIWDDSEIQKDAYDQYIYDGGDLDFEEWLESIWWQDYEGMNIQQEAFVEDFEQIIVPIIDHAVDKFPTKKQNGYSAPIFLIGSRSGWRSGSGGMSWDTIDEFSDWVNHRDYDNVTTIYNDGGELYLSSADHDGTTGGTLYTLPSDESKLLQFIKECTIYPDDLEDYRDEYADGMTDDEILLEMLYDDICQDSYDVDWFNLITGDYTKYLEPITV